MTTFALFVDGPYHGTMLALEGNLHSYEFAVADPRHFVPQVRTAETPDPFSPTFFRARYERITLNSHEGATPGGYHVFVWDGHRR